MIIVLSFFVLFILFIVFGLIFSKVKINVQKIKFKMFKNQIIEKDYFITIGLYLFGKIKIFNLSFKDEDIKFMGRKINLQTIKESKIYRNMIRPDFKELDKKVIIDNVKNLKLNIKNFNLNLSFGTESTIITSLLTFMVSTIIAIIMQKTINKYNPKKHSYIITPLYKNCNLVDIDFNLILSLKTYSLLEIILNLLKTTKNKEKISDNPVVNKNKHYPGYV